MLTLDHIAVAAETLEAGRAHVEAALGVTLQPGGQHARFGTHNLLVGLEDGLYLEVIAIDPTAQPPADPRWFDLDRFSGPPRLTNWVCRTGDMDAALRHLPEAGRQVALERGKLRWRMAVPKDGILPFDNVFPALIQWQNGGHPATHLAASGCRLTRLTVRHPEAALLATRLNPFLEAQLVTFETCEEPSLEAAFDTPSGARVLT